MTEKREEHKIAGAQYKISDILSKTFDFVIPNYQRPYSWTTEEAGELFDDLQEFLADQKPTGGDDPYFLGSIVLVKKETLPRAEVIDGQQRLTTLTILMSALVDKLSGEKAAGFAKYINEPGDVVEERLPKPRLTLRKRDNEFFHNHIQTEGKLADLIVRDTAQHTGPQANIILNAKLFVSRLEGLSEEAAFEFGKFVVNHCYLVAVSTPSMQSAYRIFSVLNDRGLDLLPTDILKSDIIGKIPEAEQDAYTKKWEDTEDALGRDPFSDVVSHVRMIYRKSKLKKTVLDEFREFVLSEERQPKALIDNVLCPYADAFQTITEASYECTGDAEAVNSLLRWLNRIDNADWIPPAMVYLKKNDGEPEKLVEFFKHLERLAASMFIRRCSINDRIDRYGKLIEVIQSTDDGILFDDASPLMLTPEEATKTVDLLERDVYTMNSRVRTYVMLRLDSWLSDGAARYDHKRLTVEHVLPQTVDDGSEWATTWPDEEKRKKWVHRLGNLLLLTRNKNSSASNWDFDVKKTKYFTGRSGVSSFAITTTVLEKDEWTESVVEQRQEEMTAKLKSGWDL